MIAQAWAALQEVVDPEIPVLSLIDLGVIRSLEADAGGTLTIGLSPTYSGCPATRVIRGSIIDALRKAGFERVAINEVLSPAWSSDWISERGRERLRAYGIAPPARTARSESPACPRCGSRQTRKISEFGSTPCKAHHVCEVCLEPFDQFKCI